MAIQVEPLKEVATQAKSEGGQDRLSNIFKQISRRTHQEMSNRTPPGTEESQERALHSESSN